MILGYLFFYFSLILKWHGVFFLNTSLASVHSFLHTIWLLLFGQKWKKTSFLYCYLSMKIIFELSFKKKNLNKNLNSKIFYSVRRIWFLSPELVTFNHIPYQNQIVCFKFLCKFYLKFLFNPSNYLYTYLFLFETKLNFGAEFIWKGVTAATGLTGSYQSWQSCFFVDKYFYILTNWVKSKCTHYMTTDSHNRYIKY